MSLQFSVDDTTRPLVSLSYQSSDEDMEVDSNYSIQDVTTRDSDDDDIQVIACYSKNSEFPPQLAAGRAMTNDLTEWLSYLNLPETEESVQESYFTQPSEELIEQFVGILSQPMQDYSHKNIPKQNAVRLTQCLTHQRRRHWLNSSPTMPCRAKTTMKRRSHGGQATNISPD